MAAFHRDFEAPVRSSPVGAAAKSLVAWVTTSPVLRFAAVLQQPNRFSKQERLTAWAQAFAAVVSVVALMALIYSPVVAWLLAGGLQLFSVASTSFVLFVLMEYEDRTSDGAEVECLVRPFVSIQLWTRGVQCLQAAVLMNWWTAWLVVFPQIPLDVYLKSVKQWEPDATTLWKTVKTLEWWCKVKLIYQGLVMIVVMIQLVLALITRFISG